ncbi:Hypothetical predicted protein [Octopus vulgaris]|uniref:Uncharacterized protein n=1 Tax=Octopus vulgaris TaxID=6645 RepID=A0AA36F2V7_OCTVU|nr:Hypothetical predicted protein [Octopus vulgaris]
MNLMVPDTAYIGSAETHIAEIGLADLRRNIRKEISLLTTQDEGTGCKCQRNRCRVCLGFKLSAMLDLPSKRLKFVLPNGKAVSQICKL